MMMAAAMSTSLFEFMYFVYGSPIMRLCDDGVRISSAVVRLARPRVRVAGGDLAEPRPQLADRREGAPRATSRGRTDRGLEDRIDLHRHHQAALELGRVVHHEVLADDARHAGPLVRSASGARCSALRARTRVRRASPPVRIAMSSVAGLDLRGRRVDQALRALAAHGGVRGLARRQAELLGDQEGRIAVLPGQQVDDAQRLRVGNRAQTGIDGGVADRRAHQQAGVERLVEIVGVLHRLADADDHWCAGVECHGGPGYDSRLGRQTTQP